MKSCEELVCAYVSVHLSHAVCCVCSVKFCYFQALNTENWPDGEPTESEKDFWEIAALEAYNQLTEWKSLQYCSTVYIDENTPPDLDRMWSEPLYQVTGGIFDG